MAPAFPPAVLFARQIAPWGSPHFRRFLHVLLAVLSLTMSGCVTPESRAKENPETFGRLNSEDKKLALKGKIRQGMSRDAVFIALGKPAHTEVDHNTEKWIYTRAVSHEEPRWTYHYYPRKDGTVVSVPCYDPIMIYNNVPDLQVNFTDGKVTGWKDL